MERDAITLTVCNRPTRMGINELDLDDKSWKRSLPYRLADMITIVCRVPL